MSLCQTCYSTLPLPLPPSTFLPSCCQTPICANCILRNPRLKDYVPCLRCGDVKSASGSRAIRQNRIETEQRQRESERGQFAIGDDDDEDDDLPPGYESKPASPSLLSAGRAASSSPPRSETGHRSGPDTGGEEEEMELVEVRHPVSKSDTILSVARKYAADPHHLLQLNNLPASVLSTQPHLLRTRPTLLISQNRIPKSKLPDCPLFDSDRPLEPETAVETARRKREREVKRFQLMTKTVDPGVGKAYLSLSEMQEDDIGGGEATEGGKKVLPEEANRTGRALEAFWDDEDWERGVSGPVKAERREGKWKVVGGAGGGMSVKG